MKKLLIIVTLFLSSLLLVSYSNDMRDNEDIDIIEILSPRGDLPEIVITTGDFDPESGDVNLYFKDDIGTVSVVVTNQTGSVVFAGKCNTAWGIAGLSVPRDGSYNIEINGSGYLAQGNFGN